MARERVRGISTTRYSATIDLRKFLRLVSSEDLGAARKNYVHAVQLGGRGTMRIDVWVDEHDLIRRTRKQLSLRLPGKDYPPDDERVDLFDFRPQPRIKPPPEQETELLTPASSE